MAQIFGEIRLVVSVKVVTEDKKLVATLKDDTITYEQANVMHDLGLVGKKLDLYDVNGNKVAELEVHDEDVDWDHEIDED